MTNTQSYQDNPKLDHAFVDAYRDGRQLVAWRTQRGWNFDGFHFETLDGVRSYVDAGRERQGW
jgi:hypothetical protein